MSEITLSTVPCDSSGIMVREAEAPGEASRQTVLALQGGGALGAYQVGVYQALHEADVEPDWVIGTSIGAINASLIAGNRREDRLDQMNAFWKRVQNAPYLAAVSNLPWLGAALPNLATLLSGISGFFQPNLLAFLGLNTPLASEAAGYYSTLPLRATLGDLVDFSVLNSGVTRLTVGAANVRTGAMRYFDNREEEYRASTLLPRERFRRCALTATSIGTVEFSPIPQSRRYSTITPAAIRLSFQSICGMRTERSPEQWDK
jgi:predicted acylesterase/phospholipase RssA